jgi:hypothetical protein
MTYKVGDTVAVLDTGTISNSASSVVMRDPHLVQKALVKAGSLGVIIRTDGNPVYGCKVLFTDLTSEWFDILWIKHYIPNGTGNSVGNALKAQRKLNEEQGLDKVPTKCNCTFQDLMGWGHKCGRKAPIDKGYRR